MIILLIFLFYLPASDSFAQSTYRLSDDMFSTYGQENAIDTNESNDSLATAQKMEDTNLKKYKNPNTAAGLAIFPGFFIHGIGHLYAGKTGTGIILHVISMTSIALLLYEAQLSDKDIERPSDICFNIYTSVFIASWFFDILFSPYACKRRNIKLREQLSLKPYIYRSQFGHQTGIRLSYRF